MLFVWLLERTISIGLLFFARVCCYLTRSSIGMAGAGVKGGMVYGDTDEYSYNIITPDQKVHVRDLHATILERCGIDFHKFGFLHQGLEQKLTGVEPAKVVTDILHGSHMADYG